MNKVFLCAIFISLVIPPAGIYAQTTPNKSKHTANTHTDKSPKTVAQPAVASNEILVQELNKRADGSISVISEQVQMGADIRSAGTGNWTVLHSAAAAGNMELINLCLKNNIPVNAEATTPTSKTTPLYWAVHNGHADAEQLLRQHNATLGQPDGVATQVYDNGNKYTGEFRNGVPSGHGTFLYADGTRFEGDFLNGQPNGQGTLSWANGDKYEGAMKDGLRDGMGKFTGANGDTYEGEYKKGVMCGKGTFHWIGCDIYVGEFENNKQSGKGTAYFATGDTYEGEWKNGFENGTGTFYWASGAKYVGNFENNFLSGQGICYWPNGERYEGPYVKNIRTGEGVYYWENGDKYTGHFENNMRSGQGMYEYVTGSKYVGEWKNDQKNGKGVFTWRGGDKYDGDFVNDLKNGYGNYIITSPKPKITIRYCKKCKIYRGHWKDGFKNGSGACYTGKGKLLYNGAFENDKPKEHYPTRRKNAPPSRGYYK